MKKFLLLTLAVVSLFACSSDDNNEPQKDSVIGTWKLLTRTLDGVPQELDNCDVQTTYQFQEDQGVFYGTLYYSNGNGGCTYSAVLGDWERLSDDMISVYTEGEGTTNFKAEINSTGNLVLTFNDGTAADPFLVVRTFLRAN